MSIHLTVSFQLEFMIKTRINFAWTFISLYFIHAELYKIKVILFNPARKDPKHACVTKMTPISTSVVHYGKFKLLKPTLLFHYLPHKVLLRKNSFSFRGHFMTNIRRLKQIDITSSCWPTEMSF